MRKFFSALSFLTIIPFPESLKSREQGGMFSAYPAAGLTIGCLLSLLYLAAEKVFPDALAAVTLMAGSIFVTGAIHLDGLADCADAFYGKRSKEQTLRILKDPRIGTMGATAIGISLLARFAALSTLGGPVVLLALPVMTVFSRTTILIAFRFLPYVRAEGGIISSPRNGLVSPVGTLVLAAVVVIAVATLLPIPIFLAALVLAGFWRLSWNRIRGCTGDVLGASIEIAEVVFLVALTALDHLRSAFGLFYPLAAFVFPAA